MTRRRTRLFHGELNAVIRVLFPLCASFAFAACATASRQEAGGGRKDVIHGFGIDDVREAARAAVQEVAHPRSEVRLTDSGVVTEGRIGVCGEHVGCGEGVYGRIGTPWTTIKVELRGPGENTAVEVSIDYETRDHCPRQHDVTCATEHLSSTGALEREIIDQIRARLAGNSAAN